VIAGRMRLVLGDHDLVLGPGEVAEFDTRVPHWFGSTGDQPAEVLSIFGPQGERMHTRGRDPCQPTQLTRYPESQRQSAATPAIPPTRRFAGTPTGPSNGRALHRGRRRSAANGRR